MPAVPLPDDAGFLKRRAAEAWRKARLHSALPGPAIDRLWSDALMLAHRRRIARSRSCSRKRCGCSNCSRRGPAGCTRHSPIRRHLPSQSFAWDPGHAGTADGAVKVAGAFPWLGCCFPAWGRLVPPLRLALWVSSH
jgi:hypothetical protein